MAELARGIVQRQREIGERGGGVLPEGADRSQPLLGRVAGEERGVDRADRDAGDPVDLDAGGVELLDHAGLIGAERAAALEDQCDRVRQRQAGGLAAGT